MTRNFMTVVLEVKQTDLRDVNEFVANVRGIDGRILITVGEVFVRMNMPPRFLEKVQHWILFCRKYTILE